MTYSAELDAFRRIVDGVDDVDPEIPNDFMTSIEEIQDALGLDIAGTKTDLAARLAVNIDDSARLVACVRGVVSANGGSVAFTEDFTAFGVPVCFAMAMGEPDLTSDPVVLGWENLATNAQDLRIFRGNGGPVTTAGTVAIFMWDPQS